MAAVVLLVLGTALPLAGCSTSGPSSGATGYITGDGVVTVVAPEDRTEAPDLEGTTLAGEVIELVDYRDEVVVINVWASWCPPCRAEAPDLVAAARQLPETAFIGINTRESNASAAEAFVRDQRIPYDSIYDEDGSALLAFHGLLSPNSLPSTMVIDRAGRVAALVLGAVDTSTVVGLVEDVTRERVPS